jgi:hypothetical protein
MQFIFPEPFRNRNPETFFGTVQYIFRYNRFKSFFQNIFGLTVAVFVLPMDYAYKISHLDIETEKWIPAKIKSPAKMPGFIYIIISKVI